MKAGEKEEEGPLLGQMLPLWGLGHYASQCSRKKSKGEASETKAAPTRVEKEVETDDDFVMCSHAPREKRWGHIEL